MFQNINVFHIFLASFLICSISCYKVKRNDDNDDHLELVHVIFRHGDRTPDKGAIYKNDPYINETYYPIGHGQLTNPGKRKEYAIGKALRKRYRNFLGDNFTLDTVDARSTDYNRTKMSLQLVLASLFPPKGQYVWQNNLNWQPVPFNYWAQNDDHILVDPYKNCPKYRQLFEDYLNSSEGKQHFQNYTDIIQYLEDNAGQKLNVKTFSDLYFTLTTEGENDYKNPYWAQSVYHHIRDLAIKDYIISTGNSLLKRLSAGFLVRKIMDDTMLKIKGNGHSNTKIFLYSAHEFNIALLLRYFDVFYPHIPPYGSYIIIEVHNFNGIRGIKLFYEDYKSDKSKRLRIQNCGNFCRLDKFMMLYNDMLPTSENECFDV